MAVLMCLLRLQVMAMHQADVHSGNIYLSIYIYIYRERERERESGGGFFLECEILGVCLTIHSPPALFKNFFLCQ